MILMIILIFLSIMLLVLYFSLFRQYEGVLAIITVFILFTILMGLLCGSQHSKNRIENTKYELSIEYAFLVEHKDSAIYNSQARKPLIFRLGDEWLIHKPT